MESSMDLVLDGREDLSGIMNSRDYNKIRFKIMQIKAIYHKFTIFNSSHLPKEFLLRLLLGLVSSVEFIPVNFHTEGTDSVFYGKDCGAAIETLIRYNLRIPIVGTQAATSHNKNTRAKKSSKKGTTNDEEKIHNKFFLSSNSVDLSNLNATEEEKIQAMIAQSTIDYDPSNYKEKKSKQTVSDVPPSYICHKCYGRGHFIKDCPVLQGNFSLPLKASTGIPRSQMREVSGPQIPGAMVMPDGSFSVRTIELEELQKQGADTKFMAAMDEPKKIIERVVLKSEQLNPILDKISENQVCSVQLIMKIDIETRDTVQLFPMLAKMLRGVCHKRFSSTRNSLDLSNFHSDMAIASQAFFPLSIYKNMTDVVNIICANMSGVSQINLSDNCLYDLEGAKAFCTILPQLKSLDLRNNSLEITSLDPLTGLHVKELFLDGNPLCDNFETDSQYVSTIRKFFPDLEWLDGVRLCVVGPPKLQLFYLCEPSGKQLVEQFVEHYFSLYDSPHRGMLLGTYHEDAMMSITCSYLTGQTTSANARLSEYIKSNRNLLRLSDCSKIDKLLFRGHKNIVNVITKLPRSEHDSSSFTAELLVCTTTMAMMSITGVFKEPSSPSVSPRYFRRQFTLVPTENNTFCIINELLYVTNATTNQANVAFQFLPEKSSSPLNTYLTTIKTSKLRKDEKKDMINTIADLTEMNTRWSKRCLVDVMWDIRAALIHFNDNYKAGNIPFEAFIK